MPAARIPHILLLAAAVIWATDFPGYAATPKTPAKPAAPMDVELIHDVEIGTGGGRTLHAEIARPKVPPATPMPAVVWIHGGGWSRGTHKDKKADWLAARGYFVASIEYRLSGEAKWPAQIEDGKLGVRWLRANAAKYHVNPDRIGCWGSSAGAHLAACLGTMDDAQFEGHGGHAGVSSRVQAVVDFWGPTDFTAGSAGVQGGTADSDSEGPLGLFGVPFKTRADPWKQGSPVVYVNRNSPPFLIVHGDNDTTVPIAHSEKLAAALKRAGVPIQFIVVKGGGHGLNAGPGEPPPATDRNSFQDTVLTFFDKHLRK